MNSGKNGWIRYLITVLIMFAAVGAFADELTVFLDHNRFLDEDGYTVHHFNYKVHNNELTFVESDDGFLALLDVSIRTVGEDNTETVLKEFTRYIGVRNKTDALSLSNYYLDKITLKLAKGGVHLVIELKDQISKKSFQWSRVLENLESDSMVSDIEFSHLIQEGQVRHGMEHFMRGDYLFYVDPVHLYFRNVNDTVFFYYEVQNIRPAVDGYAYFSETIDIRSDTDSLTIENHYKELRTVFDMIHNLPVSDLPNGYYTVSVSILDRVRSLTHTVEDYFVIAERDATLYRLFADNEREYQLLRYFLPSTYFRNWDYMSKTAQNNLIDRFWRQNDPNPQTDHNEFLQTVRERVRYANANYAYHREGWETDFGRIYVRNGQPSEVVRGNIEGDTRLTRREYRIWKYRNLNRIYLFVDPQGLGNYRLIYSRNDEMEQTMHDWERFVGDEFDKGLIDQ